MKTLLKAAVAALILFLIASRVDFDAAVALIGAANPFWIAAAIGASLLIIAAEAGFWAYSMRPAGLAMKFQTAFLFGIVGWFFINLAPSTVGADVFRAAQMRAAGATTARSIRLVAAARLMSFAALIVVIGLGLPHAFSAFDDAADRYALGAIFAATLAAFCGLLLAGRLIVFLPAALRRGPVTFAAELSGDLATLLRNTSVAGWFFLFAQHALRFLTVLAIAAALGVAVDWAALFALIPAAFLAAMVPITVGGWGVREASFVYFLGVAGIAAPAALAISILFGLTRIVIGAAGGVIWLMTRAEHFQISVDGAGVKDDVKTKA